MNNYSFDAVKRKKFICSQGMMTLRSAPALISYQSPVCADATGDVRGISAEVLSEIYDFARSHTNKLLVVQVGAGSRVVSPALFPSSSLCAIFDFDMSVGSLQRLIAECREESLFEISRYAEIERVRISRGLKELAADFSDLCRDIRALFCNNDMLKRCAEGERAELIAEHCYGLSLFTGCPVEFSIEDGELGDTDMPLFTAFVLTMLMSARKHATDRSARISITSKAGGALVKLSFDCDTTLSISREIIEWKAIAADRCMSFYATEEGGSINVEFHPYRYDLAAIYRIKQDEDAFDGAEDK